MVQPSDNIEWRVDLPGGVNRFELEVLMDRFFEEFRPEDAIAIEIGKRYRIDVTADIDKITVRLEIRRHNPRLTALQLANLKRHGFRALPNGQPPGDQMTLSRLWTSLPQLQRRIADTITDLSGRRTAFTATLYREKHWRFYPVDLEERQVVAATVPHDANGRPAPDREGLRRRVFNLNPETCRAVAVAAGMVDADIVAPQAAVAFARAYLPAAVDRLFFDYARFSAQLVLDGLPLVVSYGDDDSDETAFRDVRAVHASGITVEEFPVRKGPVLPESAGPLAANAYQYAVSVARDAISTARLAPARRARLLRNFDRRVSAVKTLQ